MENSLQPAFSQTVASLGKRVNTTHWSLGRVYLINAVFGTVIAALIWLAIPPESNPGFFNNWVHAQAIGIIICSLIIVTNCAIRRFDKLSSRLLLVALPFIVIAGFYLGTAIARMLLQLPAESMDSYNDQHLLMLSLAITVVVTVAITWFFTAQQTITELRIKSAEESERAAQAHLSMLLAQIEPHMLFNTLANLRALIGSEPERARDMLDQLIGFLRTTLKHSRTSTVSLASEFQMLENYLSLMSIRLGDRLNYSIKLPTELSNCSIPSLLLQPVVENAIKHGIEPSINGGVITVRAEATGRCLVLWVEDTGVGFSIPEQIEPTQAGVSNVSASGFGLSNVRARCTALPEGQFDIRSPLSDTDRGTEVRLQLPLGVEKILV